MTKLIVCAYAEKSNSADFGLVMGKGNILCWYGVFAYTFQVYITLLIYKTVTAIFYTTGWSDEYVTRLIVNACPS